MSSSSRALVAAVIACTLVCACQRERARADFDAAGQSPAVVITTTGATHVVYVDATTQRLIHQRDGGAADFVSPQNQRVDLRGENTPLFAERSDGALLVVYPIALASGGEHHHSVSALQAQLSRDGGRTWSAPVRVDGDPAPRSHNFADLALTRSGDAIVSWLDSRTGQQGVQTALVRADMNVVEAHTADPKTCQCCRTALFAASTGDIWLAYRDLAEGNVRNMAYAISSGGQPFVARGDVADDHWSVNGCPESGPRFAETPDGTVWLAWFDGNANAIELAAAPRGGAFTKRDPIVGGAVNHPDLGTLPDGRLIAVYEILRNGKRAIEARVAGKSYTMTNDGAFPRYSRRGSISRLAYTTLVNGKPHVRVIDPLPRIGT